MTKNDIALLSKFIDELLEKFSTDGCNDYELSATEENRQLLLDAYQDRDEETRRWVMSEKNGKFYCMNQPILMELKRRLTAGAA